VTPRDRAARFEAALRLVRELAKRGAPEGTSIRERFTLGFIVEAVDAALDGAQEEREA
jgi:hypothetical protein